MSEPASALALQAGEIAAIAAVVGTVLAGSSFVGSVVWAVGRVKGLAESLVEQLKHLKEQLGGLKDSIVALEKRLNGRMEEHEMRLQRQLEDHEQRLRSVEVSR